MENSNNTDSQKRFIIAAVLCVLILFGWQYFFAPKNPAGDNANKAANSNTNTAAEAPTPIPTAAPTESPAPEAAAAAPAAPNRKITIKTPLYEVTLDSKGAVATSWVILKNISAN